MWKFALAVPVAIIACAACDNPVGSPPAAASTPPQAAVANEPTWKLQTSAAAGAALIYTDADGVELLRLACGGARRTSSPPCRLSPASPVRIG